MLQKRKRNNVNNKKSHDNYSFMLKIIYISKCFHNLDIKLKIRKLAAFLYYDFSLKIFKFCTYNIYNLNYFIILKEAIFKFPINKNIP